VTDCGEMRFELGAYVLGALAPDEAAAVRAHLARCPQCAAERAALAPLPGLLDLAQGLDAAAAPPPTVEEKLLDRVAAEPRAPRKRPRLRLPHRWRRPLALGAAALACAAAGAGAAAVMLVQSEVEPAPIYELSLSGTDDAPRASARAALDSVPGGTEVHLWVRGLSDHEAVYEVRCEGRGSSATAGTFRVNREGRAYAVLTTALRRGEYDRIRIVRHTYRHGVPPREAEVLTGKLF
jgi:anti-sigma factor RsiW